MGGTCDIIDADGPLGEGSMDSRPERVLGYLPGNSCMLHLNRTVDELE